MPHGIHHITAIASDPQECFDFYTKILGLRLVKKSVNQDQVEAYHLFFGDTTGEPGMDLTFFTFPGIQQGRRGYGTVSTISLAVPEKSLDFWMKRFDQYNVKNDGLLEKFETPTITFYDADDQRLELVGVKTEDLKKGEGDVWETDEVSKDVAIRYFDSAKLSVLSEDSIDFVLTELLEFKKVHQEENVSLFQNNLAIRGAYLEVEEHPDDEQVVNAAGTVHHIAFQVKDGAELEHMRYQIIERGLFPTEVIDRYYFKSVYFRTPAGILFELATMGPGFTVDEDESRLGNKLALPPFLEEQREVIEKNLVEIE